VKRLAETAFLRWDYTPSEWRRLKKAHLKARRAGRAA